ncbi:MAG: hypothetical protein PHT44_01570 [Candidatus Portnoybacteria bacterium]|nr:hypothetical protein [Candidatus Portnoybacteria bacterium]MDD4982716.1 hypothetical protein [Candidatus Portnoybacteria bacterium]
MEQEKLTAIKEVIEGLIGVVGVDGRVSLSEELGGGILANIESQEAGYLIGRNGDNLRALQQLARLLAGKKIIEGVRLTVDVNNYQQERLDTLKDSAKNLARQVAEHGAFCYLPPMNAYERRIIHTTLMDIPGVKTESEGVGEERRIKIIPK